MKKIVGYQKLESKKNGKKYTVLHMVDDEFKNNEKAVGQMVDSEMISEEVEVIGDLKIGAGVRVFKENIEGLDRITLVQFIESKPDDKKSK